MKCTHQDNFTLMKPFVSLINVMTKLSTYDIRLLITLGQFFTPYSYLSVQHDIHPQCGYSCSVYNPYPCISLWPMFSLSLKKSETQLTASVLKKKNQKHTRGLKERFLIGQDNTICANFRESSLFRSYARHRNKYHVSLMPSSFRWHSSIQLAKDK